MAFSGLSDDQLKSEIRNNLHKLTQDLGNEMINDTLPGEKRENSHEGRGKKKRIRLDLKC